MPEGPECRCMGDGLANVLEKICKSNNIKTLSIYHIEIKDPGFKNNMADVPLPINIIRVFTKGKKVIIELEKKKYLIFSFGMSGTFALQESKHTRIVFHIGTTNTIFEDMIVCDEKVKIYFNDVRKFGSIDFVSDLDKHLEKVGPDVLEAALTTPLTTNEWMESFSKIGKKRNIASALLDPSFVSGIGNYCKSDILYQAGISPHRTASSLTCEEWERIRKAAHDIILESYRKGGLSIKDYVLIDGNPGNYQPKVYNREFDDHGNRVIKENINARPTYWVPELQNTEKF